MWSGMAKTPTFTTTYADLLLCPTTCYLMPLFPTSYQFPPHRTRFLSVVKRKHAFFRKKIVGMGRQGALPGLASTHCGFATSVFKRSR